MLVKLRFAVISVVVTAGVLVYASNLGSQELLNKKAEKNISLLLQR